MRKVSLKDLLEAGAHFGHKTSRWNPAAKKYIYGERNNIHIIDLVKTKDQLEKAAKKLNEIGSEDGGFLLVGAKRQIGSVVRDIAEEAGVHYMTTRWVGGMITNWEEVKKRIDLYNEMGEEKKKGVWAKLVKHERVKKDQDREKLRRVYGGVVTMTELPKAVYIVDTKREKTVVREASRAGIMSIGISDTNSDPRVVNIAIPANDDAAGSVQYITQYLVDAYLEGKKEAKKVKKSAEKSKNKAAGKQQ